MQKVVKTTILIFALVLCLMPMNAMAAKKVKLNMTKVTMVKGDKEQLMLNNVPKGKKIKWSSNKKSVATVTKKGKVTAKKTGKAKITAKVNGKKYTCMVTVKKIRSITLSNTKGKKLSDVKALQKILAKQKTIGAKLPEDITDLDTRKYYTWDKSGRLTGIDWGNKIRKDTECIRWPRYDSHLLLKGNISFAGLTNLTSILCNNNKITSLDVSKNKKLTGLYCGSNQLTSLDVSKKTKLTEVSCNNNQLTSLDASGCTQLVNLWCNNNQLTSLDVIKCKRLFELQCSENQLTSLDVSDCTRLYNLKCNNNQLIGLDVSNCTRLYNLECNNNQLTSLDVKSCKELEFLECENNQITTLDVRNNPSLSKNDLHCDDNVTVIWK